MEIHKKILLQSILILTSSVYVAQYANAQEQPVEPVPYTAECQARLDDYLAWQDEFFKNFDLECPINADYLNYFIIDLLPFVDNGTNDDMVSFPDIGVGASKGIQSLVPRGGRDLVLKLKMQIKKLQKDLKNSRRHGRSCRR